MAEINKRIKITFDASEAKKGIESLKASLGGVSGATDKLTRKQNQQARATGNLNKSMINVNRSLNAMRGLMIKVSSAAAAFTGIRLADDFNELQNKLRLTIQEGETLLQVQNRLVDTSLRTRSSLQENALLYLRLSNAVDRNKVSQEQLFEITESVNKAVQLGGSSAQEAAGAVRQFTQIVSAGFSSGFSQEINSLSEQTPGLFKLIADGLRETSEEFREMEAQGLGAVKILKTFSEEGLGDLDTLLDAIASQTSKVNEQFDLVNITVAKSIGNIRTALENYIGGIDDATGATSSLANKINDIALNFDIYANKLFVVVTSVTAAIIAMKSLAIAINLVGAAIIFTTTAFNTLAASQGVKALLSLSLKAGAFLAIKLAIVAVGVAVGVMASNFVELEGKFIIFGEKTTQLGEVIRATFVVIGRRLKLFQDNSRIAFENFVETVKGGADAIVQFFSTLDARESGPIKFLLKDLPDAFKEVANGIIRTVAIIGRSIGAIFANMFLDFQGSVEKIKKKAELAIIELRVFAAEELFERTGQVGFIQPGDVDRMEELKAEIDEINKSSFKLGETISNIVLEVADTDFVGEAFGFVGDQAAGVVEGFTNKVESLRAKLKAFKDEIEDEIKPFVAPEDPVGITEDGVNNSISLIDRIIAKFLEWKETIDAIGNAVVAFTDLFATLSSIRQDKIDDELRTSMDLSDEERKTKEQNAKQAFETSKKLTLAGIALQTGLAIMNALADTTQPSTIIRIANAAAAAATGAAQYARANAQQYNAPSAPSSGVSQVNQNTSNDNRIVTINITAGTASAEEIAQAVQSYVDNDGIIINPESAQGRALSV